MRGVWWVVLLCVGVYLVTSFFGNQIMAHASGDKAPLVLRDVLEPGTHHISGMIDVGFSCENVSVDAHRTGASYELEFNTWRDEAQCSPGPVARDFALELEGPSDLVVTATLDGVPIDIALMRQTRTPLPSHL